MEGSPEVGGKGKGVGGTVMGQGGKQVRTGKGAGLAAVNPPHFLASAHIMWTSAIYEAGAGLS